MDEVLFAVLSTAGMMSLTFSFILPKVAEDKGLSYMQLRVFTASLAFLLIAAAAALLIFPELIT